MTQPGGPPRPARAPARSPASPPLLTLSLRQPSCRAAPPRHLILDSGALIALARRDDDARAAPPLRSARFLGVSDPRQPLAGKLVVHNGRLDRNDPAVSTT